MTPQPLRVFRNILDSPYKTARKGLPARFVMSIPFHRQKLCWKKQNTSFVKTMGYVANDSDASSQILHDMFQA